MFKQVIIARKDLNMSSGKLAAQVSHGSIAFLTNSIRENALFELDDDVTCVRVVELDRGIYEEWINGAFTKCVLEARNKSHLLKAKAMAEELGLREGVDFFLIRDNCYTELTPEDADGRTLTCIGFKPMDSGIIDRIGKKYQLYR